MIRTGLWEALGGLDEAYESECQDIDLCLAAHRLGWDIEVLDEGPVVHLENATRPAGDESWPDRRLLFRRWESYLEANFL
jgi:GT2 family glycosyltransferase